MSIFDDFFDFVGDAVEDVGDVLEDTWRAVKSNPIGAITSAVAMAYGIPPMWAGALGGGAGAAATGGNIVKGAFTGGAMGYMGSMAGAATGSLGPIAQAAAMGATSAATGAVLTGQDVMTAVKAGLILGTVSGGVAQLLSPAEAIAQVPKDQLAEIYSKGQDPLGDLIKQQGWTDSDSARAAASQVFSKNSATTIAQLKAAVPDYVLKEAQVIAKTGNPQEYINEQMGWANNGVTNSAATRALDDFIVANKTVNSYGPKEQAPVTDAVSKTPLEIKTNEITSTGLVDAADAQVLANGGYTATDVQNLVNAGYNPADLANMAATGVPASTLTSLSNTQFTEAQINNLLTNRISANDIASTSNLVNAGKLSVTTAESLMKSGVNSFDMKTIANSGKADAFAKLVDSGINKSNAQFMLDRGVDLNKAAELIESGKLTVQELDSSIGNGTYNKVIQTAGTEPVAPTPTETPTTPAPVAPGSAAGVAQSTIPDLDQMWAKYDLTDSFNPKTGNQSLITSNSDTFADNLIKEQYGAATNQGVISNAGNPNTAYYKNLEAAVASGNPEQYLYGKGYNQTTVDQLMDYYEAKSFAQSQYQGQQVASGYTAAQEAQYNQLIQSGMTPADAVNQIANTPQAPTPIEVSGGAGFSGNPSSAIPEYRTPNTDLATQAQIDSGAARFNAGANAWEVPTQVAPPPPVVPIIPPVVTPPPAPATPPKEEPVVPVVPPAPVTPPVVTPPPPVVQPPAPVTPPAPVAPPVVQPPAPVTTVSSSTRTTSDGSVYKDDQKSDGTVVTTLLSGPTGSGSGTGGTSGTVTPPTPVTPPLTPPVTEVIPPDTTYVAPVEVTPTEPVVPEPPVTTPEVPTLPIVPIVPPVDTPVPEEDNYRGKYTWGTAPKVKIPTGLNPGWMAPQPFYKNTTDAQAQYYWGSHPYQPGPTFNSNLYNNVPAAPATPWGATQAARSATGQQIIDKMGDYYPLLGPVRP